MEDQVLFWTLPLVPFLSYAPVYLAGSRDIRVLWKHFSIFFYKVIQKFYDWTRKMYIFTFIIYDLKPVKKDWNKLLINPRGVFILYNCTVQLSTKNITIYNCFVNAYVSGPMRAIL